MEQTTEATQTVPEAAPVEQTQPVAEVPAAVAPVPEATVVVPAPVIPKECKAGVVFNEGPNFEIKIEMVPVPEPGPDEILIKLNCTGLCMSDVHFMLADWDVPPMSYFGIRSPGHEGAGEVVKLGSNVKTWKIGDRAGVKPLTDVCYACEECWSGRDNYCANAVHTGLMATGTYQQYVVAPARYATPIPDGVPDYIAAPIMCSASTMVGSLEASGLRPGQWAVFPGGGGGVGIQGIQIAKAMGLRSICIDTGEEKRKLSMEMGAEVFIDFKEVSDIPEEVKKVADGIGAHAVFVTAIQAYANAPDLVGDRVGGKVMCIGLPPGGSVNVSAEPGWFVLKNRTITGTLVGNQDDARKALDYAKRGLLKQICEVVPLDKMNESVQKLRHGQVAGRIVVDFNK